MSDPQPDSIGCRLAWVGGATVGCFAAASLVTAIFRILGHMLHGDPLVASTLLQPPVDATDLVGGLLLIGVLAIGLARRGWSQSALRRVLFQHDASTRTDVGYVVLSVTGLGTAATTIATLGLSDAINAVADTGIGLKVFAELPLYLGVPAVIIVNSFASYWCHRAMHMPLMWHLHAVHHAATDFNGATAFRNHPIDSVVHSAAILLTALLGFSGEALLTALIIIYANGIYCHSDLPTNAFLERWVLFGPHGHGIHHGADPICFNTNFGNLVFWDRLFGTYKTDVPEPLVYGCDDPQGIYQTGRPLRDMVAVQASWLRTVWGAARTRFASAAQVA